MKYSLFNISIKNGPKYVLFNTYSSAILNLDRNLYQELLNVEEFQKDKSLSAEENILIDNKVLADDSDIIKELITLRKNRRETSDLIFFIYPTLNCNFKCRYCFQNEYQRNNMSIGTMHQLVKYITLKSNEIKSSKLNIVWMGGEPLLTLDKIEFISNSIIKNLNRVKFESKLITNGYLMNSSVINRLSKVNITSIQVTVDGTKSIHDARRLTKNGNGTFDKIINNVDIILSKYEKIHVIIRVNLDKSNVEDFPKLFEYLVTKFKNSNYSIAPSFVDDYSRTCKSGNESESNFNRKERSKFYLDLYTKFQIKTIDFLPTISVDSCISKSKYSCAIGPNGAIYKCTAIVGDENCTIGNIFSNDHLDCDFAKDDYLDDELCKSCNLFPVCSGGCPLMRTKRLKNGEKIDTCHLSKGFEDKFIKFYLKENNKG